jgi:transposase
LVISENEVALGHVHLNQGGFTMAEAKVGAKRGNLATKYVVRLSPEERTQLQELLKRKRLAARKRIHAQVLLKVDEGAAGPGWPDSQAADAFGVCVESIRQIRRRFVEQGLEAALERRKQVRPSRQKILDGEKEARLVALACQKPPDGRARWTLRLLGDKLVELKIVETVCHETVRRSLKKTT